MYAFVNIDDKSLYKELKHRITYSTDRAPEEIKLGSIHSTNKAFERYFQVEPDDLRNIYRDTRSREKERIIRISNQD